MTPIQSQVCTVRLSVSSGRSLGGRTSVLSTACVSILGHPRSPRCGGSKPITGIGVPPQRWGVYPQVSHSAGARPDWQDAPRPTGDRRAEPATAGEGIRRSRRNARSAAEPGGVRPGVARRPIWPLPGCPGGRSTPRELRRPRVGGQTTPCSRPCHGLRDRRRRVGSGRSPWRTRSPASPLRRARSSVRAPGCIPCAAASSISASLSTAARR